MHPSSPDAARVDVIATHVDVIIVGGGITGLAAAWFLTRHHGKRVVVLEASGTVGGKIAAASLGGIRVDRGPDAFLARVEGAVELARELGLGDDLVAPATGQAWLWSRGKLHRFPEGLVLGVPSQFRPLARSGILSPKGVLRAGLDAVVPKPARGEDPTVAEAIGGHLGREVVERLVDPLLGGINASDCDRLSLASAAPNLIGSARAPRLMRSLRSAELARIRGTIGTEHKGGEAPVFLTPRTGVTTLVDELGRQLGAEIVRTVAPVQSIRRSSTNTTSGWTVSTEGANYEATSVLVATPAAAAAELLEPITSGVAAEIRGIRTASVALTLLLYRQGAIDLPQGSGMLVPRPEGKLLTASSWWNQKWPHLATPGHVLLRASAGRDGDDRFVTMTDEEIVDRLHGELAAMLGIRERPSESRVTRWMHGFPQYDSGHEARVRRIHGGLQTQAPGVLVAGASYEGIGIPACIRSARRAANALA